jgi:hypothetical protein
MILPQNSENLGINYGLRRFYSRFRVLFQGKTHPQHDFLSLQTVAGGQCGEGMVSLLLSAGRLVLSVAERMRARRKASLREDARPGRPRHKQKPGQGA